MAGMPATHDNWLRGILANPAEYFGKKVQRIADNFSQTTQQALERGRALLRSDRPQAGRPQAQVQPTRLTPQGIEQIRQSLAERQAPRIQEFQQMREALTRAVRTRMQDSLDDSRRPENRAEALQRLFQENYEANQRASRALRDNAEKRIFEAKREAAEQRRAAELSRQAARVRSDAMREEVQALGFRRRQQQQIDAAERRAAREAAARASSYGAAGMPPGGIPPMPPGMGGLTPFGPDPDDSRRAYDRTEQYRRNFRKIRETLDGVNQSAAAARKRWNSLSRSMRSAGGVTDNLVFSTRQLIRSFIGYRVITEVSRSFNAFIGAGFKFNQVLEQSRLGMAGVMVAAGKVTDETGKQVFGQQALAIAIGKARRQQMLLRNAALETTATYEQLLDAYPIATGPGRAAGFSVDEVRKFAVLISQAAANIALPQNQLSEEIRAFLTPNIRKNATRIAQVIQVDNEDIRRWQAQGTLFENLEDKLKGFRLGAIATANTLGGLSKRFLDLFQITTGKSAEAIFGRVQQGARDLFANLTERRDITLPDGEKVTGVLEPSQQFQEAVDRLYGSLLAVFATFQRLMGATSGNRLLLLVEGLAISIETVGAVLGYAFAGMAKAGAAVSFVLKGIIGALSSLRDATPEWLIGVFDGIAQAAASAGVGYLLVAGALKLIVPLITGAFGGMKRVVLAVHALNVGMGLWTKYQAALLLQSTGLVRTWTRLQVAIMAVGVRLKSLAAVSFLSGLSGQFGRLGGAIAGAFAPLTNTKLGRGAQGAFKWLNGALATTTGSILGMAAVLAGLYFGFKGLAESILGVSLNFEETVTIMGAAFNKFVLGIGEMFDSIWDNMVLGAKRAFIEVDSFFSKFGNRARQLLRLDFSEESGRKYVRRAEEIERDRQKRIAAIKSHYRAEAARSDARMAGINDATTATIAEQMRRAEIRAERQARAEELRSQGYTVAEGDVSGQDKAVTDEERTKARVAAEKTEFRELELIQQRMIAQAQEYLIGRSQAVSIARAELQALRGKLAMTERQNQLAVEEFDFRNRFGLEGEQGEAYKNLLLAKRKTLLAEQRQAEESVRIEIEKRLRTLRSVTAEMQEQLRIKRTEQEYALLDSGLQIASQRFDAMNLPGTMRARVDIELDVQRAQINFQKVQEQSREDLRKFVTDNAPDLAGALGTERATYANEQLRLLRDRLQSAEAVAQAERDAAIAKRDQLVQDQEMARMADLDRQYLDWRRQELDLEQKRAELVQDWVQQDQIRLQQAHAELMARREAVGIAQEERAIAIRQFRAENAPAFRQPLDSPERQAAEDKLAFLEREYDIKLRIAQLDAAQAQEEARIADLYANGSVWEGMEAGAQGFADQFASRFQAGIDIAYNSLQQFSSMASQMIVDAFDPTIDMDIEERFARFFQSIAQMMLEMVIRMMLIRALMGSMVPGAGAAQAAGFAGADAAYNTAGALFHQGGRVGYAAGGDVVRPRGLHPADTIPIWAAKGEWVIRRESARRYGANVLDAINRGMVDPGALKSLAGAARYGKKQPRRASADRAGYATGGMVAGNGASGGTAILPVLISDDRSVERMLSGGRGGLTKSIDRDSRSIESILAANRPKRR